MATLLVLRRRIKAAQNVSKTTRAMQMIAASKLKRAQNAATSAKPYVEKLTNLTQNVSTKIEEKDIHPYMSAKKLTGKTLLLVVSPDKGLCGGLITNLIREFLSYRKEKQETSYLVVGKKMEGRVARLEKEIIASFGFGTSLPTFDMIAPILRLIDEYYLSGKVDSVKILSTHFNNIFSQTPQVIQLLPISFPQESDDNQSYMVEPSADELLPSLVKHYIEMVLYQHLLESFVSEQASRMIAMQNATNNAKDIIEDLRLEYNKSRQAKITSEILDISSAANVLETYGK